MLPILINGHCSKENGQELNNADQTYLALASYQLVLQKTWTTTNLESQLRLSPQDVPALDGAVVGDGRKIGIVGSADEV